MSDKSNPRNFSFLRSEPKLKAIGKAAETAEDICLSDAGASCALSRRAAEFAVKWMLAENSDLGYAVNEEYIARGDRRFNDIDFNSILKSISFRSAIGEKTCRYLNNIRITGNDAAHKPDKVFVASDAERVLKNLHFVLRSISTSYFQSELLPEYDSKLIPGIDSKAVPTIPDRIIKAPLKFYVRDSFTESLASLPAPVKDKASKVVLHIQKNGKLNTGYSYIPDADCPYIIEMPIDFKYSLIVFAQESTCYLLYVSEKADAVNWGKKIKCEVNLETYELQIYESALPGIEAIAPNQDKPQKGIDLLEKPEDAFLFRQFDEDILCKLGVPQEYFVDLLDITTMDQWKAMGERLPSGAFSALSAVLGGFPIDRAVKETFGANTPVKSDEFDIAAQNPQVGSAPIDDEDEFKKMLEAPLEKWRVFLHPQQRKIAYRQYSGASRVLGGAGTGKSVVALHRAKFLADSTDSGYRILFTTFTKPLTKDIKDRLNSICTVDSMKKITVINLDKWIADYIRSKTSLSGSFRIEYDERKLLDAWKRAMAVCQDLSASITPDFLMDEWGFVIQAQGIRTCQQYLSADRRGRGIRVDKSTREQIWTIVVRYSQIMQFERWYDIDRATNYCIYQLQQDPSYPRYDSVIVDECPDFGPTQFRLLRELAGKPHENDMFLTGDPRQRIYTNKPIVILSKCGISVKGRSNQLILNYRTTGNILKWANRLLEDVSYNDLDGGHEDLQASVSPIEGDKPVVRICSSQDEEAQAVTESIKKHLACGVPAKEIAVIARTKSMFRCVRDQLFKAGINASQIDGDNNTGKGIQLVTMHSCKGLEFSYVYIIGINKGILPYDGAFSSDMSKEKRLDGINAEKMLFHVALTRARMNVEISTSGEPSEFLSLLAD